jgi:hypothetical protein
VPLTVGGEVDDGGVVVEVERVRGGGELAAEATTVVWADVEAADPLRFVAVTVTRSVEPASADVRL